MRVIRPKRPRQVGIELAAGRSQPPWGDRSMRIDGTLERDLDVIRVEDPENQKEVGIDRRRRDPQLRSQRASEFSDFRQWRALKGKAVSRRIEGQLSLLCGRLRAQRQVAS